MMGEIKQALQLHEHRHLPNPKSGDINYIKIMTNAVKNGKKSLNGKKLLQTACFAT
jgi:hypothetical protein